MNPSVPRTRPAPAWKAACLVLGLGWLAAAPGAAQVSREYDVKAAFLYNFATFVDWPQAAFAQPESPFVIGVMGVDPFGTALEEIVMGERIKGRPVVLRRFTRLEVAGTCHILFISGSEKRRLQEILQYLRERPVLTVADMPGFAEAGGIVGFTTESRIRIKINATALRATDLAMSSKLLRLGQVIETPPSLP